MTTTHTAEDLEACRARMRAKQTAADIAEFLEGALAEGEDATLLENVCIAELLREAADLHDERRGVDRRFATIGQDPEGNIIAWFRGAESEAVQGWSELDALASLVGVTVSHAPARAIAAPKDFVPSNIPEIRARLAGRTQGRWVRDQYEDGDSPDAAGEGGGRGPIVDGNDILVHRGDDGITYQEINCHTAGDAVFVLNAPTDIEILTNEVEVLRRESTMFRESVADALEDFGANADSLEELFDPTVAKLKALLDRATPPTPAAFVVRFPAAFCAEVPAYLRETAQGIDAAHDMGMPLAAHVSARKRCGELLAAAAELESMARWGGRERPEFFASAAYLDSPHRKHLDRVVRGLLDGEPYLFVGLAHNVRRPGVDLEDVGDVELRSCLERIDEHEVAGFLGSSSSGGTTRPIHPRGSAS